MGTFFYFSSIDIEGPRQNYLFVKCVLKENKAYVLTS